MSGCHLIGGPSRRPRLRAAERPARVRSRIRSRANWATALSRCRTRRPVGEGIRLQDRRQQLGHQRLSRSSESGPHCARRDRVCSWPACRRAYKRRSRLPGPAGRLARADVDILRFHAHLDLSVTLQIGVLLFGRHAPIAHCFGHARRSPRWHQVMALFHAICGTLNGTMT